MHSHIGRSSASATHPVKAPVNKIAAANAGERPRFALEPRVGWSPPPGVADLYRSAGSGRPVCKHSVEAGRESSSTADARRLTQILSCVSRDSRLHSQRSDIAGGHCVFPENEGPEILE